MTEPIAIIRSYDDLIEGLRLRKDGLQVSNTIVDDLAGLTRGHCDKVLGPTRLKGFSRMTFDLFLEVLGVELVLRPNLDAVKRMESRWEQRQGNYRSTEYQFVPARLGKQVLERAKPLIYREAGRSGGRKRAACLPAKQRSAIARKAARKRWRNARAIRRASRRRAGVSGDIPREPCASQSP